MCVDVQFGKFFPTCIKPGAIREDIGQMVCYDVNHRIRDKNTNNHPQTMYLMVVGVKMGTFVLNSLSGSVRLQCGTCNVVQ